jgi:hypothetical protein
VNFDPALRYGVGVPKQIGWRNVVATLDLL